MMENNEFLSNLEIIKHNNMYCIMWMQCYKYKNFRQSIYMMDSCSLIRNLVQLHELQHVTTRHINTYVLYCVANNMTLHVKNKRLDIQ